MVPSVEAQGWVSEENTSQDVASDDSEEGAPLGEFGPIEPVRFPEGVVDGERSGQSLLFAGEHRAGPHDGALEENSRLTSVRERAFGVSPEVVTIGVIFESGDLRVLEVLVACHSWIGILENLADIEFEVRILHIMELFFRPALRL